MARHWTFVFRWIDTQSNQTQNFTKKYLKLMILWKKRVSVLISIYWIQYGREINQYQFSKKPFCKSERCLSANCQFCVSFCRFRWNKEICCHLLKCYQSVLHMKIKHHNEDLWKGTHWLNIQPLYFAYRYREHEDKK